MGGLLRRLAIRPAGAGHRCVNTPTAADVLLETVAADADLVRNLLSKTLATLLATQSGMMNGWLRQQGLISFRDLWIKVQGYVLRPVRRCPAPGADPHAGWCGEG